VTDRAAPGEAIFQRAVAAGGRPVRLAVRTDSGAAGTYRWSVPDTPRVTRATTTVRLAPDDEVTARDAPIDDVRRTS
jgi:hypothetical protein